MIENPTPKSLGYYFPAEFSPQRAIWLSWPHNKNSWPGKINSIYPSYAKFVKEITLGQLCCINVVNTDMKVFAETLLQNEDVDMSKVEFFIHPTNDAWCRDHGPAFLVNKDTSKSKVIVNWDHNAWGGKYPPYDLDTQIPLRIAETLGLQTFSPGIVMEGGSVEFNGKGTILTSTACLLNDNRNPHLNQAQIEQYLMEYYGADQILWVDEGIIGDDTDGHIDDTVRFVNEDTVLTVIEENKSDENYALLQTNLKQLKTMRLINGKQLNIIELPMPDYLEYEGQRLPASYANFLITNRSVIVPIFNSSKDDKALEIIQSAFPDRTVVGIDSEDIIWGLGSFHCLSQQEPL